MRNMVIRGIGWVTPLGNGLEEVWESLAAGKSALVSELPPESGRPRRFTIRVARDQADWLERLPRIRRSSAITYYAIAASLAAMEDAGLIDGPPLAACPLQPETAAKTAIICAIGNGGVRYTRRFFEKLLAEGASAASPLLFPETVYNAPASHLAAVLGLDNATYTLVGDAATGLAALNFAGELLATNPALEQCVVVGSEECDWILCEAYAAFRVMSAEPCVRLHGNPPSGTILAEGAAAVVVGRASAEEPGSAGRAIQVETATAPFTRRSNAWAALQTVLEQLSVEGSGLVVGSANGTWVDCVESEQLRRHLPHTPVLYPKAMLGEAPGASSLMQVIAGAMALEQGGGGKSGKVAVTAVGLSQQTAGALLHRCS